MSEWPIIMSWVIVGQMWNRLGFLFFYQRVTSVMVTDHGIVVIYISTFCPSWLVLYFDHTPALEWHPRIICAKGKDLPKNQFYRICCGNLKLQPVWLHILIGICLCQITVVLANQPSNSIYMYMCILRKAHMINLHMEVICVSIL